MQPHRRLQSHPILILNRWCWFLSFVCHAACSHLALLLICIQYHISEHQSLFGKIWSYCMPLDEWCKVSTLFSSWSYLNFFQSYLGFPCIVWPDRNAPNTQSNMFTSHHPSFFPSLSVLGGHYRPLQQSLLLKTCTNSVQGSSSTAAQREALHKSYQIIYLFHWLYSYHVINSKTESIPLMKEL